MADEERLSFLDETSEEKPEQPEPEAVEEEPEQVEAQAEPEQPAEPEDTGEQEAAPPVAEPETNAIPVTALLDEREKRQKAERELEALRQWRAEQERQQRAAQQKAPDWYEDPEKAAQYQQRSIQQTVDNVRLDMSEEMARSQHGNKAVDAAFQALQQSGDPYTVQRIMQSRHPWGEVVSWHKKQDVLSKIGDDPDSWIEQQVEARLKERLAQQPAQPKAPPASLNKAPAAGRDAIAPGNAFDSMFPE